MKRPASVPSQLEVAPEEGPSPRVVRFRLTIAYDGTAYQGWQLQKVGVGVQEKVEGACARLFGQNLRLHGSSRTDTGVHALGLVAHVDVPKAKLRMSSDKLLLALNAHLPGDIRIMAVRRCRADFHARFDAAGKQYRYFVWNHSAMLPLLRHCAWHVPRPLDFEAMRTAARFFLGTHDFRSFAAAHTYEIENTVRTVRRFDFQRKGPWLAFVIEGDGFLYRMCRGMVGTVVQVGLGRFAPEAIDAMIAKRDRRLAGMSAPAHGLVLWKVFYQKPSRSAPRITPERE